MFGLFKKKPAGSDFVPSAPGKKLCLYDVRDFPRDNYTVYPEIMINAADWSWVSKLLLYRGGVAESGQGTASNETEARHASQTWVLRRMPRYKVEK
jgi:hypothetical protein